MKKANIKNPEMVIEAMDNLRANYDAIHQIHREFPRPIAEEIIARILCGESVDSAIQATICPDF